MNKYCTAIILFSFLIRFPAAAQVVTIGTGSAISAKSPHNHGTAYSVTEIIYYQSEINTSGYITHLAFHKHDGTNLDSIENVQFFLTHTSSTSYVPVTFDTTGTNYTEVFSGNFPNNALTGWMEVELQTPFYYDGVNNLQVMLLKTNSTTNAVAGERARYNYTITASDRVRRYNSDTPYQLGVTQLTTTDFTSNIRLTFATSPPDCPVLASPADNAIQICPGDPMFSWSLAGGSPPTNFEFYLGTDGGGTTLPTDVINGTLTGNVLNYQYSGTLAANTTYYWSAVSLNTSGSATGCQIYSFTTGNLPPFVSFTSVPPGPLFCFGEVASVAVDVSGGTPPYTYLWSTGQTAINIMLSGGSYSVTVTDSISCQVTQFLGISQPPAIISNLSSTPDSTGSPNCSGTVSANPTGGTPPFTVSWSSGSTINLCAGWYTATITDANGCIQTDSVFVDFGSGINELTTAAISVYPNPANSIVIIKGLSKINFYDYSIFSIDGKLWKTGKLSEEINVDELTGGIYFLEIKQEDSINRLKFIKTKNN